MTARDAKGRFLSAGERDERGRFVKAEPVMPFVTLSDADWRRRNLAEAKEIVEAWLAKARRDQVNYVLSRRPWWRRLWPW
jgi:hypothetical protein